MSYERRRKNGEDHGGHLEGVRGCGGGGVDGERGAGDCRESGVRVVALGDTDDCVHDGCVRRLAPETVSWRKAYKDAMAWLLSPESNPDAWMLKGATTHDWDGRQHH